MKSEITKEIIWELSVELKKITLIRFSEALNTPIIHLDVEECVLFSLLHTILTEVAEMIILSLEDPDTIHRPRLRESDLALHDELTRNFLNIVKKHRHN